MSYIKSNDSFKSKGTDRELLGAGNLVRKYTPKNQSKSRNNIWVWF